MTTAKTIHPSIVDSYVYLVTHGRKKIGDIPEDVRPYVEQAINKKLAAAGDTGDSK